MQTRKSSKRQSPSMRLIGALLGQLRTNAHMTQRTLAERLCVHEETIASIEQGRRSLLPDMADQVDLILTTGGLLGVAVAHVPTYDKYPVWAQEFVELEQSAISLSSFENQVIPGLLQTQDYARATFRTCIPALSEDDIELRISARLDRQNVLHRKVPVTASFVIAEAVLLSNIGGSKVTREQVRHLRTCVDLPGVCIQIMPLDSESHAGLSGPFVLLETPDHQQLAYFEAQVGSHLLSAPDDVSLLAKKYGMLRTQALNAKDSRCRLEQLLGET